MERTKLPGSKQKQRPGFPGLIRRYIGYLA